MSCPTKAALSPARRHTLELMQRVNFGRIEGLVVRGGEPVFDPAPRIVREVKLGAENGSRPEPTCGDFALKAQAVEFFDYLKRMGDGTVECVVIKHGLPFSMSIEEKVRT